MKQIGAAIIGCGGITLQNLFIHRAVAIRVHFFGVDGASAVFVRALLDTESTRQPFG